MKKVKSKTISEESLINYLADWLRSEWVCYSVGGVSIVDLYGEIDEKFNEYESLSVNFHLTKLEAYCRMKLKENKESRKKL